MVKVIIAMMGLVAAVLAQDPGCKFTIPGKQISSRVQKLIKQCRLRPCV
jgi:hypothetical protein